MGSGTPAIVPRRWRRDSWGRTRARPWTRERAREPPGPERKSARRPDGSPAPHFPYGGSSIACRCPARVAPRCAPSHESPVLLGVLSAGELRGRWASPLPPRPRDFARAHAVSLRPPSAPPFDGVSSSRELSAFSRVLRPARCPSCLIESCDPTERPKSASHGVHVPHRDIDRRRPPLRGESRPRGHVPSSTFPTSSTACSATCLRGLVSSRCHVQGLPSRGLSLSAEPCRVSPADSCPPAVGTRPPVTSERALGFRALLPAASAVSVKTGWASTDPRPSWASCSSGYSPLRIVGMPSHSLRPRPSPRRTPRGWPPASRRCAGWLAWIQAAGPLELSDLNPQPPFESRVRGLRFRRPTRPPDTG
jgi:hypothetical protein